MLVAAYILKISVSSCRLESNTYGTGASDAILQDPQKILNIFLVPSLHCILDYATSVFLCHYLLMRSSLWDALVYHFRHSQTRNDYVNNLTVSPEDYTKSCLESRILRDTISRLISKCVVRIIQRRKFFFRSNLSSTCFQRQCTIGGRFASLFKNPRKVLTWLEINELSNVKFCKHQKRSLCTKLFNDQLWIQSNSIPQQ